jgi:hypothetical protein
MLAAIGDIARLDAGQSGAAWSTDRIGTLKVLE